MDCLSRGLATAHLRIVPLTRHDFALWLEEPGRLAEALGVEGLEQPEGHLREAMCGLYAARNDAFPWRANWQIILKDERAAVGSACFMGPPDAEGVVEIGYGLHEAYRGRGLMAEAVRALTSWALAQDGVRAVAAETEKGNGPSRRVLERCGFLLVEEREGRLFWRSRGGTPELRGEFPF